VSENVKRKKGVESAPHKTIQLKLFSPFAEFLDAKPFGPGHVRTDLPPYHDILGIHCTRRRYLDGTRAIEVSKEKWSGGHVGVEVALPPTKGERMLWVGC